MGQRSGGAARRDKPFFCKSQVSDCPDFLGNERVGGAVFGVSALGRAVPKKLSTRVIHNVGKNRRQEMILKISDLTMLSTFCGKKWLWLPRKAVLSQTLPQG
jgi:hypothetical protein